MSRLFPLFDLPGATCSPLGLPMCQNRLAVPTWSYAMEMHPPARIIELGTYGGGFITALALHAANIGCKVITYERDVYPDQRFVHIANDLGVEFRHADMWERKDEINALIQEPGVTYVLCDGGDKPAEFSTFAKALKSGDVIAAHDYVADQAYWVCSEVRREELLTVVTDNNLEAFYQEHFDMAAWLAYRKR